MAAIHQQLTIGLPGSGKLILSFFQPCLRKDGLGHAGRNPATLELSQGSREGRSR